MIAGTQEDYLVTQPDICHQGYVDDGDVHGDIADNTGVCVMKWKERFVSAWRNRTLDLGLRGQRLPGLRLADQLG